MNQEESYRNRMRLTERRRELIPQSKGKVIRDTHLKERLVICNDEDKAVT